MDKDIKIQLDRIEAKLDELFVKKDKKQTPAEIKQELKETVQVIYNYYKNKINKRSRLIKKAENKIIARLKEYSEQDLKKAIDNFSQDDWWMKNNAQRGVAWFFHSEDRIEQFINLIPQKEVKKLELYHKDQPCKYFYNQLKIYAPWSNKWLDWNKDYPQYEEFVLKEDGKIVSNGKEAFSKYKESSI